MAQKEKKKLSGKGEKILVGERGRWGDSPAYLERGRNELDRRKDNKGGTSLCKE